MSLLAAAKDWLRQWLPAHSVSQCPSPNLRLPAEIRNEIFDYLAAEAHNSSALFFVSRQTRREFLARCLRHAKFKITDGQQQEAFNAILNFIKSAVAECEGEGLSLDIKIDMDQHVLLKLDKRPDEGSDMECWPSDEDNYEDDRDQDDAGPEGDDNNGDSGLVDYSEPDGFGNGLPDFIPLTGLYGGFVDSDVEETSELSEDELMTGPSDARLFLRVLHGKHLQNNEIEVWRQGFRRAFVRRLDVLLRSVANITLRFEIRDSYAYSEILAAEIKDYVTEGKFHPSRMLLLGDENPTARADSSQPESCVLDRRIEFLEGKRNHVAYLTIAKPPLR